VPGGSLFEGLPLATTRTPRVFISSTLEDLGEYRRAALEAILRLRWQPIDCGYWAAEGNPPLATCLNEVDDADALVVIVARRHGWTPPDQPDGEHKSITRLECERAHVGKKIEVIPFFLDEDAPWDARLEEGHRIHEAPLDKIAEVATAVARNVRALKEFKEWLDAKFRRKTFRNPDHLCTEVLHALTQWGERRGLQDPITASASVLTNYLAWLRRTCESVEFLGLDAKETNNVRLGHVYVPAITLGEPIPVPRTVPFTVGERRRELLLDRLGEESLCVPGAPGVGKSTFCRWVALAVASRGIPSHPVGTPDGFAEVLPDALSDRFPLLCRLRELAGQAACLAGNGNWTRTQLEAGLACWLEATRPGGLTPEVFREALAAGRWLVILDGVDEVPERLDGHLPRRNLLTGLADALPGWVAAGNRVLITSRPYGLGEEDRCRLGLPVAELAELPAELQAAFIRRWYAAADPPHAEDKATGLIAHLDDRPDLAELRGNPMLLTALCVKYDEGQRLPQDFYRLYDSVVRQVLYKRYATEIDRDRARLRLGAVALGMHRGDSKRPRLSPEAEVTTDEVDLHLAALSRSDPTSESGAVDAATRREDLLSNSGLLLPRGEGRCGFYHLTFQEFLAALRLRAIDEDPHHTLASHAGNRAWHRTLVFLFCALAEVSPEAAINGYDSLLDYLAPDQLEADPVPAILLADCLEVAHARGWNLDRFATPLRQACDHALDHLQPQERAHLWRTLGRLGLDNRPGVGVIDGLPDIDWVEVPGGPFKYGGDLEEIFLDSFRIARHPVTNAQFQAFVDDRDYDNGIWWEGLAECPAAAPPSWSHPNHPRETVSWYEAVAFSRWLTARLRVRGHLADAQEIRLPTEQEWERAARGTDGRKYPWQGEFCRDHANIEETLDGPHVSVRTSAVGIYPRGVSPCGALDMAGNVWEWCLNAYLKPLGSPAGGEHPRVLRGGSWGYLRVSARCATRFYQPPVKRSSVIGFRLVVSSLSPEAQAIDHCPL